HYKHPWKTILGLLSTVTLGTIINYLINRQDPDYFLQPQRKKTFGWLVRNPFFGKEGMPDAIRNLHWLWLPKFWSAAYVYGTVPEAFLESWDRKHPKALDGLWPGLANLIPNFTPSLFQGILHQITGK